MGHRSSPRLPCSYDPLPLLALIPLKEPVGIGFHKLGEGSMIDAPTFSDEAERLGLALAIGFLVGIERGWKYRDAQAGDRVAGLRTFTLAGLLGGVSGAIAPSSPGVAAALTIMFSAGFILFQFRHANNGGDSSATSTVAGITVFGLGAHAVLGDPAVAAAASVAVAAILAFKEGLHAWLGSLSWSEIRSALLILAATFIVLPFVPPGPIDPWQAIDPRSMWIATIAIAVPGFGGYVALRALGRRVGVVVGAMIGGVVSSTAVTVDVVARVKAAEVGVGVAAVAVAVAVVASVVRVVVVVAVVLSGEVAGLVAAPLAAGVVVLMAGGWLWTRAPAKPSATSAFGSMRSPLDLRSVAGFAGVLCLLTVAANLANRAFGHSGLSVFAVTAGLVDVDAVVLSVSNLLRQGLPPQQAAEALMLALAGNQAFKLAAIVVLGARSLAARFALLVLPAMTVAAAVYILMLDS